MNIIRNYSKPLNVFRKTIYFRKVEQIKFDYGNIGKLNFPGPLQTAFDLKNSSAYNIKSAGCDCADRKCY